MSDEYTPINSVALFNQFALFLIVLAIIGVIFAVITLVDGVEQTEKCKDIGGEPINQQGDDLCITNTQTYYIKGSQLVKIPINQNYQQKVILSG